MITMWMKILIRRIPRSFERNIFFYERDTTVRTYPCL